MKIVIESSAYLIIMVLICLLSVDFISMNMGISRLHETEQYIEDYVEIYGEHQENHTLDAATIAQAQRIASEQDMEFTYEYETQTQKYAYYRIQMAYSLQSKVFHIGKTHRYNGLVRVELEEI